MLYAWFSRRHLGNEVCWDSGHPSYRDKKFSKRELGREKRWTGEELVSRPTTCSRCHTRWLCASRWHRTCFGQLWHGQSGNGWQQRSVWGNRAVRKGKEQGEVAGSSSTSGEWAGSKRHQDGEGKLQAGALIWWTSGNERNRGREKGSGRLC